MWRRLLWRWPRRVPAPARSRAWTAATSPRHCANGRGAQALACPVGLPPLAEDLRGDGKHQLALLVAALRIEDQQAAVGARFQVNFVGEARTILHRVTGKHRPWPTEVLEAWRGTVGGERDTLRRGGGACPLPGGDQTADIARGGMPARGGQRAEQRGFRRALVEVERLRVPGAGEGDDGLLAEAVSAEIEGLADLAILEEQIGLARQPTWRTSLPQVQGCLARRFGGGCIAGGAGCAPARELVGDPGGDDLVVGVDQLDQHPRGADIGARLQQPLLQDQVAAGDHSARPERL